MWDALGRCRALCVVPLDLSRALHRRAYRFHRMWMVFFWVFSGSVLRFLNPPAAVRRGRLSEGAQFHWLFDVSMLGTQPSGGSKEVIATPSGST